MDWEPISEEAEISNLTAFGFGCVLDYSLNESIALRLEPMYLQKGYKSAGEMYNLKVEGEEKHTYIEFPVMLKYAFGLINIFVKPDDPGSPDAELKTKGIQIFAGFTFPLGK